MSLNGIDISGWQKGINLSKVPCDFAITKATGGTKLVSSCCDQQIQSAKKAGKLWGFYHFAREKGYGPSSGKAEAQWFVKNCRNYFGHGVPVLDYEQDTAQLGVKWAKEFLDTVYQMTGVRPMIYMSLAVVKAHDWSSVAKNYGLWVAAYPSNNKTGYKAVSAPKCGAWGSNVAIYQYSSHGSLSGFSGWLDLDIFYGDENAWNAFAGVKKQKTVPKADGSKSGKIVEDGIMGPDTIRALQKHLGVQADGIMGKETVKALQKYLNKQ
ncbi:MAG: GH25 family lysozyme [Eubacterium sp.]